MRCMISVMHGGRGGLLDISCSGAIHLQVILMTPWKQPPRGHKVISGLRSTSRVEVHVIKYPSTLLQYSERYEGKRAFCEQLTV